MKGIVKKIRLIARLDVKDEYLVKGIQYEGLRKLGDPCLLYTSQAAMVVRCFFKLSSRCARSPMRRVFFIYLSP